MLAGESVYISGVESDIDDALENVNTDDSTTPTSVTILDVPALDQLEIAVDTSGASIPNYVLGTGFALKAGTVTGPYFDGFYIKFDCPVPYTMPVTVIHNFDK